MTRDKAKELAERALWTFLQAFLAAWVVFGFRFDKVALAGAAAAGLSALKTFIKETL